jgi:hypothetical protein
VARGDLRGSGGWGGAGATAVRVAPRQKGVRHPLDRYFDQMRMDLEPRRPVLVVREDVRGGVKVVVASEEGGVDGYHAIRMAIIPVAVLLEGTLPLLTTDAALLAEKFRKYELVLPGETIALNEIEALSAVTTVVPPRATVAIPRPTVDEAVVANHISKSDVFDAARSST